MERLKLKYSDAVKALDTLKEIMKEDFSIVIRDASIQRFEYTFEAVWKFLKEYLKDKEGIIANTPKAVFRGIFSSGFLTETETVKCLAMTNHRNETSHTYKEAVSEVIYENIPDYVVLMGELLGKFKDKL